MKQKGKKTIVCVLLCVLVCMVSAFALAGCKKTEAPKKYSVIFMNGDTQISEQTVEANKEAVKPADPTKESSVSTVYTFAGWALTADGEVVTDFTIKADTTFYAVYTPSARKYTVKFMDGENQLSSADVDYDAQATKPADPTKAADAKYTYTFAGWALTADGDAVTDFKVTGDVTYYAVYTSVVNKYDVKFMLDGEQVGDTQNIDYDTAPTMPKAPTKAATAEYTYTFAGWYTAAEGGEKVEDFTVKGNATYYGRFTATKNRYEIKFVDGDGNQVDATQTVEYGTAATAPATATKAATDKYTYAFDGWYTAAEGGEKVTDFTVKANATYYAHFTSTVNKYEVKFVNEDGKQIGETQSVEYDAKATKPANPTKTGDAQYSYDFEGWYNAAEGGEKVEDFTVKGNVTYYARYTRRVNKYTVKIIDGNGADLSETSMEYGSIVELPAPTEITGKYFVEWRDADDIVWKEDSTVKGNVTLHPFYKEYGLVVDESFYQRDKSDFTVTASEEAVPLGYKTVWTTFTTKDYIHGGSYSKIVLSNYAQVRFAIKTDGNFFLNGKSTNATHDWLFFELVQNEDLTWKTTVTNALGEVVYAPDNLSGARSDGGYVNQALNSILFGIPKGFYPKNTATDKTMNIYFTEVRGTLKKSAVEGVKVDESVYNVNKLNMTKVTDYAVAGYETVMTYTHTGNSIHGMNYSAVDLRGYSEIHFAFRSSYGFNFNNVVSSYDRDWMYFTLTQNDDETWNLTAKKADGTVITTIENLRANKDGLGDSYTPYALNAILYGIPSTGLYPNKSDSLSELTVWTTEIRGTLKAGA